MKDWQPIAWPPGFEGDPFKQRPEYVGRFKSDEEARLVRRRADEALYRFLSKQRDLYVRPEDVPVPLHIDIEIYDIRLAQTDENGNKIENKKVLRQNLQAVLERNKDFGSTSLTEMFLQELDHEASKS